MSATRGRFTYVERSEAESGEEAMQMYPWARTWGRTADKGWLVFEREEDRREWLGSFPPNDAQ